MRYLVAPETEFQLRVVDVAVDVELKPEGVLGVLPELVLRQYNSISAEDVVRHLFVELILRLAIMRT
jgi:ABC-type hemin transport system substrate-binding protein